MARHSEKQPSAANKSLELKMAETLNGLTEFATTFAYRSTPAALEILSIESPRDQRHHPQPARVYRVPLRRSNDVVSFLIERESRSAERIA